VSSHSRSFLNMVSDAHQFVARSQQPYAELTTLSVVFVQAQHESKQVSELV
jgi:hypothetical protein